MLSRRLDYLEIVFAREESEISTFQFSFLFSVFDSLHSKFVLFVNVTYFAIYIGLATK